MILSNLIVKWLEWIVEIGLWLLLAACFVYGIKLGDGFFGSIVSAVLFVLFGGVFGALLFGFFIVLNDIRRILRTNLQGSKEPADNASTS